MSSCYNSGIKICPFHWWIPPQYFGVVAFANDNCVYVVFAFLMESVQIVAILAWWINLSISFDVSQYTLHVVIHGVFLFLCLKDFRVIKTSKANWNIHRNLFDYILLLDEGEVGFKEVDWAFLNQRGVSGFIYFFEKILKFCVH